MEDIAVVGLGLRFPGNATSPEELWNVLDRKESQWSEFPKDRLNIDGYYHPSGRRQGGISFRGGHFLKEDITSFDASFFAIPTEEANAVDPQQRVLLEVSYEALENAGIKKEDIDGGDGAVYVGSFVKDYEQICLRDPDWSPQYAATGNGIAIMANRISYVLNLHGPSMTIDTGCSGSLIAVHLAAQSLRTGETSLALAAGAGMILTPNTIMPMTALNFLSPDGKCFTFDSRANGYGRGEGIGVVVMKRLSDALRDNDTIHAVIRASSTNQDGRTTGITLPSKEAQVANIRSVYANAGLDFNQTAYVECHGTGTQAGDWRELRAISETLAADRSVDNPIVVGSVKTNIGHLEGAAGIAGLIKGVLTLEHGRIPPNINFIKGNPNIDFESWKIKVPTEMLDWPIPGVRRVSVNCFGFGGSNAHVVMDEAPGYLSSRGLKGNHSSPDAPPGGSETAEANGDEKNQTPELQLFCYSAHDKNGVGRVMDSHIISLEGKQDDCSKDFLRNYAYTLGCRRSNLEWKGFAVADSTATLLSQIRNFDQSSVSRSSLEKQPKLAFIFCGQGAQWAQMGKDLMSFHAFSDSLKEASTFMKTKLDSEFDLVDEIFKDVDQSGISHPMISQPATTALQVALVDLLNSFGVLPKYVVGHSSGEIAAAYASGALSRQDAWKTAYYRGIAAATIPVRAPKLKGGMMVVGMSLGEVTKYLTAVSKSAQVACINSPRSITISGQADAIDFIAKDLRQNNTFCRVLDVKVAYHSSHMKLVEDDYKDSLGEMTTNKCREGVKMFSSVSGGCVTGTELDAAYWAKNLVSPVQYIAAIQSLMSLPADERPDTIIELSPGAALRSPTTDILDSVANASNLAYYSALDRKQNGPVTLLKLVGELWSRGCPVDMKSVVSRGVGETPLKCLSNLPSYPWNHSKQYWHESHLSLANRFREYPRQDLIGAKTADSVPFEPRWRGFLRIPENPWIQDHQVQKTVVYPAAGMVSMVLEGAKQMAKGADNLLGYELADMRIEKAMLIPNNAHGLEVALNIKSDPASTDENSKIGLQEFAIYSKPLDRPWERHASGTLRFHYKVGDWEAGFRSHEARYQVLSQSCMESLVPRQLYEHLDAVGMNYGSLFQNITEVRKSGNSCVSKVRIPDTKSKMPSKFEYPHLLHPTTLDSMFQTLLAIEPLPMVPVFIKSLFVSANLGGAESGADFAGYATTNLTGIRDAEATIVMRQANIEQAYVVIDGLRLTGLSSPSPQEGGFLPNHRNLCTQITWKEDAASASPISFEEQVAVIAHKYPALSVLQVGGGYLLTRATLRTVAPDQDETPRLARYTIFEAEGDDTASRALYFVEDTLVEPFVEKISDISDIQADYHLIVVCNDAGVDADSLKKNLKVGGVLLKQAVETETISSIPINGEHKSSNETNGSTNGVRESGNGLDESSNGTDAPSNETHETANGYDSLEGVALQNGKGHGFGVHFLDDGTKIVLEAHRNRQAPTANGKSTNLIVLKPQEYGTEVEAFIDAIKQLEEAGQLQFAVSFMSAEEVLENVVLVSGKMVVSLLDFSGIQSRDSSIFHWEQNDFEAFHALQKYAKGILWITRGAHMSSKNPKGSPIVALARTLISEDPLKAIATFDLGIDSQLGSQSVVQNVLSVFDAAFGTKSESGPREMEFAEEAGKLYIPRLVTIPSLNRLVEGDKFFGGFAQKTFAGYQSAHPTGLGLKLTIAKPGIDDGSLYFTEFEPHDLKPDEVEIAFGEASLSFLDLETVMGRTDDSTIGVDVKGQVKRVGNEVSDLSPGDNVVALVAGGAIQDVLHVKAQFVKRIDVNVVPSFLISAYYALFHVGRAGRGRRVLIHAGASAFGLVAVDLAVAVGAEVFATVIGAESAQQRQVLEQHGLSKDHILDVETGSFVGTLQAATDGKGVDVVYNPTLESIDSSFKCVRKCGSVVQFASKSPSPHATRTPPASMTIVNLDLRRLLEEDADFVGEMFDCAAQLIANLALQPVLSAGLKKEFQISGLQKGLKHIQGAPYLGFASVVANPDDEGKVSVLSENVTKPLCESLDARGTYVLAGGLGGLGRSISDLLVRNGVRHLAYLSRSGAFSEIAKSFIEDLQRRGVDARAYAVDICDEAALASTIKDTLSVEMPPVRGVFQCAAVIRDAVFDNMTFDDWNTAIKPKTVGSWNLMQAITAAGHDPFYIFLASSAGVIGNRGQANYAAGNCFEDSLARYLRQQGKHAVAVDLGPVLGAGMLAEDDEILDILRASGFYGIRHGDFIKVIEHSITGETLPGTPTPAQVTLGVGTGGIIQQNQPADPYWSRTALYSYLNLVDMPPPDLSITAGPASLDMKSMLACASDIEAASTIVCTGLSNMLAKAMNMLPEEVDVTRPPNAYGVDSLVAVGVRNWVLSNCNVQISVFEILSDSTIAEMSSMIAEKGGYGVDKNA